MVTRTERDSPYPNVVFVRDNAISFVDGLRNKNGKEIWLFGGAKITQLLMEGELIDVLMLAVHPIVLRDGLRLFGKSSSRRHFEPAESIRYPSGFVQMI